jgi:hypothetical protein
MSNNRKRFYKHNRDILKTLLGIRNVFFENRPAQTAAGHNESFSKSLIQRSFKIWPL